MRILILSTLLTVLSFSAYSQNNVGIGTTTPEPRAILDVASTNKGMLIPRMTTAQRNAIDITTTPMDIRGLMVYDMDLKTIYVFNGTNWINLTTGMQKSVEEDEIFIKGTGTLQNGTAVIPFEKGLFNSQQQVIITVTPIGNSNGLYVEKQSVEGFVVRENNNGKSNIVFNWIAVIQN